MYPFLVALRALLLVAACAATLDTAQATSVLYEQAPLTQAQSIASQGQHGLLVETFTVETGEVAKVLSWWGTAAEGFDISLVPGAGSAPNPAARSFTFVEAGFSVLVDIDGDPQTGNDDGLEDEKVYLFSIDVGALPEGTYSLGIWETTTDANLRSWFWLHGATGDGSSQYWTIDPSVMPEGDANRNDMSLRVEGEPGRTVPAPGSAPLAAAALGVLVAWRRRHKV